MNSSILLPSGNSIYSIRDQTWADLEGINRLYEQVAHMPLMPTSVSLLPFLLICAYGLLAVSYDQLSKEEKYLILVYK